MVAYIRYRTLYTLISRLLLYVCLDTEAPPTDISVAVIYNKNAFFVAIYQKILHKKFTTKNLIL